MYIQSSAILRVFGRNLPRIPYQHLQEFINDFGLHINHQFWEDHLSDRLLHIAVDYVPIRASYISILMHVYFELLP